MTLVSGTRLGPYEVVGFIGRGGMGEVYRARDTKLGRDVALKILPHAFTADPDRRARFEREARALATLNHQNVGAVYGFEEQAGPAGEALRAIVLELVAGETLAERLIRGPVPVGESLVLAMQIADALEAAHEKGIVHRDVKPSNIKIAPGDVVKVLDFGLAKFSGEVAAQEFAQLETLTVDGTGQGVIFGTARYMSPEQARRHAVDKRADIWAFGCVLYEMLTGRSPFLEETVSDTIAAILHREPDWAALPPAAPPGVARLLKRCLAKDPKHRLRDIGDARLEIQEASTAYPQAERLERAGPANRRVPVLWWLAGAALVIAAAALGWKLGSTDSPRDPLAGATFTRLTDWEGGEQQAALSRDGRFVAFISDRDGSWDAWVGQIGTGNFHNLTNGRVPELRNPAVPNVGFTPDASLVTLWVRLTDPARGVQTDGWVVPTMGGQLRPYMDRYANNLAEVDWSPDSRRIAYHTSDSGDPMFVADPNELTARQIYVAPPGIHNHFTGWSPDGAFIYFVRGFAPHEMDLWRIRPAGGDPERLTFHESRVSFPTFLNARTLLYLATAGDGTSSRIHVLDVESRVSQRLNTGVDEYTSLHTSADGRRLVATVSRSTATVWRARLQERASGEFQATRVTLPTSRGVSPRIGPEYMVYRAPSGGTDGLWRVTSGGASNELWGGRDGRVAGAPAVAPDGRQIAFPVRSQDVTRLYVMNADGSGVRRVSDQLDVRGSPSWSPDGRWIAIAANRDGQPALFKVPISGGAPVLLVEKYAIDPVWSPSGRFLVYSGADVGMTFPVKAVAADGSPHPFPDVTLSRGSRRLAFLGSDSALVLLKGDLSHKEFWVLDLQSGVERQLTAFGRGFTIGDFDVSADGREIVFDRTRDESDIVLIELQQDSR